MANNEEINIIKDFLGIGLIKCDYKRSFDALAPISFFACANASNDRDSKIADLTIKVDIKFENNDVSSFIFLAQFVLTKADAFKKLADEQKQVAIKTMFSISFPFARQTITNLMTDSFGTIQLPLINILRVADITKGVVFLRGKSTQEK